MEAPKPMMAKGTMNGPAYADGSGHRYSVSFNEHEFSMDLVDARFSDIPHICQMLMRVYVETGPHTEGREQ